MSRGAMAELMRQQRRFIAQFPEKLTAVPSEEIPNEEGCPLQVWRSRKYLAQLYAVIQPNYPGMMRLSVCRTTLNANGRWDDGLSWDELQAVKAEVGFAAWYGVEVYPPEGEVVNVANFRHLWLLPEALPIGWFKNLADE